MTSFITFDASPSPDALGYICQVWERYMVKRICETGETWPCMTMSAPKPVNCEIDLGTTSDFIMSASNPPLGAVIYGCILAFDTSFNPSACVGGPPS